jgi:hypothetical protein
LGTTIPFTTLASSADAAHDHGLSQGLIESTNTKIRLLTRIAFGFRSPEALIALAMFALGGHRPSLPGRTKHPRMIQSSPTYPQWGFYPQVGVEVGFRVGTPR